MSIPRQSIDSLLIAHHHTVIKNQKQNNNRRESNQNASMSQFNFRYVIDIDVIICEATIAQRMRVIMKMVSHFFACTRINQRSISVLQDILMKDNNAHALFLERANQYQSILTKTQVCDQLNKQCTVLGLWSD